jgi:hypothetical protein
VGTGGEHDPLPRSDGRIHEAVHVEEAGSRRRGPELVIGEVALQIILGREVGGLVTGRVAHLVHVEPMTARDDGKRVALAAL